MAGSPMYHARSMPLANGWNHTYTHVPLQDDSRFGLGSGTNNTLGLSADSNGGYRVEMGSRERAGLDFGPGMGTDQTYYIYRGCTTCNTDVVVGHGDPTDPQETLPNNLTVVDHYRGWSSISGCGVSASKSWSGTGNQTMSNSYSVPSPAHSAAGGHYIDSRYEDLSVLPGSHTTCSGNLYSEDTDDNRKHDMCISSMTGSSSTSYSYPYTKETETYRIVNGTPVYEGTTYSYGSKKLTTSGSCSVFSTSGIADGYRFSAKCDGGPTPKSPPKDSSSWYNTTNYLYFISYSYSSPSATTSATARAVCSMNTNTPHLDLEDAMSLRPGLNMYRPPAISASHNILVVYDDAQNGGGSREYIQVYRAGGLGANPAGPYDFHLKPTVTGILYDAHRHYGYVDTRLYDTGMLAGMGYTEQVVAGQGDGLGTGGSNPYSNGRRLCHGDCFMGIAGMDSTAPVIRDVTPANSHTITGVIAGLVYDHVNDRWFDSPFTGARHQVVASSLYLTVPFAEDVSLHRVWMFGDGFDPAAQNPSPRTDSTLLQPCHLAQSDLLHVFAGSMNVTKGESLEMPVLPQIRYMAFIGNGDCYWYDVTALPSPLSSVSSGARHVPLVNGTILSGDLTVRHDGEVHVDVTADLTAVWQSQMQGVVASGTGNVTWVVPPLQVNITAVARVNGMSGDCNHPMVYCSDALVLEGTTYAHGSYIHGTPFPHGEPYAHAPRPLPPVSVAGDGVYGLTNGRCYGLAGVEAATGGIVVRDIPHIRVSAGDTVTLSFEAVAVHPGVVGGNVTTARPASSVCVVTESVQSAILDVTMMTATLR